LASESAGVTWRDLEFDGLTDEMEGPPRPFGHSLSVWMIHERCHRFLTDQA
jgi:hypothetical protein